MWEDTHYCWVVVCKNHWFHLRQNFFYGHKIPLAETDAFAPLTGLERAFAVRCNECGKECLYKITDVRRFEQELPESFTPHPLFREDGGLDLPVEGEFFGRARKLETLGILYEDWVGGQPVRVPVGLFHLNLKLRAVHPSRRGGKDGNPLMLPWLCPPQWITDSLQIR
jgi:hypothetical protein